MIENMADQIKIDGLDSLDDFIQNHTKELDKTVSLSLAKGARVVNKAILNAMPGNLQKFKPILSVKTYNKGKSPAVLLGFFGRKMYYVNRRGVRWDSFFMVYWQNFGTMANRDSSHQFITARRKKTKTYSGGIRPSNFFERGVMSGTEAGLMAAQNDLNKIINSLANKYGFR